MDKSISSSLSKEEMIALLAGASLEQPDLQTLGAMFRSRAVLDDVTRNQVVECCASGALWLGETDAYNKHLRSALLDYESFENAISSVCGTCHGKGISDKGCPTCHGNGYRCDNCGGIGRILNKSATKRKYSQKLKDIKDGYVMKAEEERKNAERMLREEELKRELSERNARLQAEKKAHEELIEAEKRAAHEKAEQERLTREMQQRLIKEQRYTRNAIFAGIICVLLLVIIIIRRASLIL